MGCKNGKPCKSSSQKNCSDEEIVLTLENNKKADTYKEQVPDTNYSTPQKTATDPHQQAIENLTLEPDEKANNNIPSNDERNQANSLKMSRHQYEEYQQYLQKNKLEHNEENLQKFKNDKFQTNNPADRRQTIDLPTFNSPPALQKLQDLEKSLGNNGALPEKLNGSQNQSNKKSETMGFRVQNRLSLKVGSTIVTNDSEKQHSNPNTPEIKVQENKDPIKTEEKQNNPIQQDKKPNIEDFQALAANLKVKDQEIRRRQFSSKQYEHLDIKKQYVNDLIDTGLGQQMADVWRELDDKDKRKLIQGKQKQEKEQLTEQARRSVQLSLDFDASQIRRYSMNPDLAHMHQFSLAAAKSNSPNLQTPPIVPEKLSQEPITRVKRQSELSSFSPSIETPFGAQEISSNDKGGARPKRMSQFSQNSNEFSTKVNELQTSHDTSPTRPKRKSQFANGNSFSNNLNTSDSNELQTEGPTRVKRKSQFANNNVNMIVEDS